jgi:hypothetical protein
VLNISHTNLPKEGEMNSITEGQQRRKERFLMARVRAADRQLYIALARIMHGQRKNYDTVSIEG